MTGALADMVTPACELKSAGSNNARRRTFLGLSSNAQSRGFNMPIIHLFVVLIVIGVLLWLVNNYIPMAGSIKRILNIVVVIVVVLWLLNAFGILNSLSRLHV
jgi:hypothetical protein